MIKIISADQPFDDTVTITTVTTCDDVNCRRIVTVQLAKGKDVFDRTRVVTGKVGWASAGFLNFCPDHASTTEEEYD